VHQELPAGKYTVTARKRGFASKTVRVKLPPGETKNVVLHLARSAD